MPQSKQTKHFRSNAIAGLAVLMVLASNATSSAAPTTTSYTHSTATLVNPERGFFKQHSHCERQAFDHEQLLKYRTRAISLMRCVFYLPKTADISAQITELHLQAGRLRAAGMKMILRFAYTDSKAGDDAPPARVQEHLDSLTETLRQDSDVIAVMESGFVGAWGEGYYTQNFGNAGVVNANQWAARNAVVDKLLRIMPRGRKVVVRTLRMKSHMFPGESQSNGEPNLRPATVADFNSGTDIARVGHVNDCFLSDLTDQGTFAGNATHVAEEKGLLAQDTQFVPMGGETCAISSRSKCPTAVSEMAMLHYTYLHLDYKPEVVASWATDGCLEPLDPNRASIQRQLGYRFSLVSATSDTTAARGAKLPLSIRIRNYGWSSTINPRSVKLVLRHTGTGAVRTFPFTSTRNWRPGALATISSELTIPTTMPVGTYEMLLSLPDPAPALAMPSNRQFYAIRLANDALWDKPPGSGPTGFNKLLRTVRVQ